MSPEVTPRLAQSDAQIGPLSRLTASGRAIPETLAAGVLQSQGILGTVERLLLERIVQFAGQGSMVRIQSTSVEAIVEQPSLPATTTTTTLFSLLPAAVQFRMEVAAQRLKGVRLSVEEGRATEARAREQGLL